MISKASLKKGKLTRVYLQVNCSGEESKSGETVEEWGEKRFIIEGLEGILVEGLMTMAPFTSDQNWIRKTFLELAQMRGEWGLKELSMGMSHDYQTAVKEGSTCLRVGSLIFDA